MAKENAVLNEDDIESWESLDFDELEEMLQRQLEDEMDGLDYLKEEQAQISNPDKLGEIIQDVVWEQFVNQIAVTAGEDFIKDNRELLNTGEKIDRSTPISKEDKEKYHLDLSDKAHIQTEENFANGELASHNYKSKDVLEKSYDRYKNKPHKQFRKETVDPGMNKKLPRAGELYEQGVETVTDIYTGEQIPTKTKLENGKNNPEAAQREHVTASAEIYNDPGQQMGRTDEELGEVINHKENLQGYTTAERNNRKSDKSTDEMDEADKTEQYNEAKKKSEKFLKKSKEDQAEKLKKEGRQTQKEEAFRIGGKALRAVLMQLLAELVREIISKLVKWFKSAKKGLESLLDSLKEAISSFVGKMKTHLIKAGDTVFTTIATSIVGPIFATVKKVWMMLKQGWKSLVDAVNYIRSPENKGKPIGRLMLETGKIVIAGMTGIGALALGEVIEKGLMTIPLLKVDIPLIGSLANILGVFFGAVIAGIIGAIAINLIDKLVAKKQKNEVQVAIVEKGNDIIVKQHQVQIVNEVGLEADKENVQADISGRHQQAASIMKDVYGNIMEDFVDDFSESTNTTVIDEEDIVLNQEIERTKNELDDLLASLE